MDINLTPIEARVLGALIEKETATPDYYPLSLSATQTACNQKSNRDPVMSLRETEVLEALEGLIGKRLAREKTPSGSRVTKYAHRLSNTLGLVHEFSAGELALLCVLMLRGPQTLGELRTRTSRLFEFEDLQRVEEALAGLIEREDGPYVARLAREPGRKEARYAHLLCGPITISEPVQTHRREPDRQPAGGERHDERLSALEERVESLREELERLKRFFLD